MEGKHSSPRWYFDLLKKIGELTRSIIEDLCNGRSPTLYIDQYSSYCTDASENCCCNYDLPKGKEILTLQRESQARRLDVLLRVLLIVQQLLQEPSVVDQAINDISILLNCSRHNLNVVSVGKGLVMGWLKFAEAGRKFDCINSPNTAHHIPVHVEDVEGIKGRGYPDVPTRRFLRLLIEKLHLPVYCLIDCDPYGIDILTTFRFGSMQMAYDAKSLRLPEIRWVGAFVSDCEKYRLPDKCLLPLTTEDKHKAEGMLHRCYMEREVPSWRSELQLMLDRGVKFEIEALSAQSLTFLSENYLPSKIEDGAYI